jgi:hypothetical protein
MLILLVALLVATFALGACGDDDDDNDDAADDDVADDDDNDATPGDDDDDDDATPPPEFDETCPAGPALSFNLQTTPMIVPYPNDLYTVADATTLSGRRVNIDGTMTRPLGSLVKISLLKFVVDSVNTLDGFGTFADLYMPTGMATKPIAWPDQIDPGLGDAMFVMVDDATSAFDGEFAPVTVEERAGALQLRPYKPLHEATHYVLVATRGLTPKGGECFKAAADMRRLWDEFYGYEDAGIGARYHDSLAHLEQLGLQLDRILAISDFTTLHATRDLNHVRGQLDKLAQTNPPEIAGWEYVNNGQPGLNGYVFGTVNTPVFQDDSGVWRRDANGDLIVQGHEEIELVLSLPDPATSKFQQPYPIVLHGHGVGGFKDQLTSLSSDFAVEGFAVLAIDSVCHGPRAPIPFNPTSSLLCYFDFFHPLRFRDNFRETIANHLWLTRAIKESLADVDILPWPDGDGVADFDVSNLYYAAVSLGSIHGGIYSAVEDNVDAYVNSSAAAKFIGIALEGPYMGSFVDIARMLDGMMPDLHAEDALWMVGHLAQHVLDAADPANYLMHTEQEPLMEHVPWVLQQSSSDDYMLGGLSGAYFARSAGWPQFNPYVWDAGVPHVDLPHVGSGFYQFNTDEHFFLWMDTGLGPAYREQALHYFRSHKETGEAEVIDPLAD